MAVLYSLFCEKSTSFSEKLRLSGNLFSGVIHRVILPQNQLGNRNHGVSLLNQPLNDSGEGGRGVFRRVVEQDNGSRLDALENTGGNVSRCRVFPIQTVYIPFDGVHSAVAHGGHHTVIIITVGRPEQIGAHAGEKIIIIRVIHFIYHL